MTAPPAPDKPLTFSVIIPTRIRPQRLQNCLLALARQDFPKSEFEVLVVDDASETRTSRVVDGFRHELNIRLISQSEAKGPATARNAGADHSQGEYLAFTDDDCEPEQEWLCTLFKCLAEPAEAMVGGHTVNALPENVYSSASQLLVDYFYRQFNRDPLNSQFLTSNNAAISAEAFDAAGGFDVTFPLAAAEDRDFCARWLQSGKRIIYVPAAIVKHSHHMGLNGFVRQHFSYGRGAYHYRRLCKLRDGRTTSSEPLAFYANLLRFPFTQATRRIRLSLLLLISQGANTLGYFYEKIRTNGFANPPLAKTAWSLQ